ncbi:hypothetical protein [Curtobacterium citreum]|uniref:hypothetical protein n=1 Tax=Curtobacterium citreum TaxID=2036 RepID=UPI00217DF5A0|nr:hypothetical protein [Curtobacterium flaccumfaciens]MCS6583326.1 hypothetical protein [Curtobacterium flaccumfaciens pv. beticola]
MTVITDCTNRRAHRHTLPELRPLDAYADRVPRNIINKYIELHEQPDARKQYRAETKYTGTLRDLFTFVRTYRPFPTAVKINGPFTKALTYLEPVREIHEARDTAALAALEADEVAAAQLLNITVETLRGQHWHATSDAKERAEKRRTLGALRAGLLTGSSLQLAVRRWGTTAWENLATFCEPDAPKPSRRPRNRTGARAYRWFPETGGKAESLLIGWPRDPALSGKNEINASARP